MKRIMLLCAVAAILISPANAATPTPTPKPTPKPLDIKGTFWGVKAKIRGDLSQFPSQETIEFPAIVGFGPQAELNINGGQAFLREMLPPTGEYGEEILNIHFGYRVTSSQALKVTGSNTPWDDIATGFVEVMLDLQGYYTTRLTVNFLELKTSARRYKDKDKKSMIEVKFIIKCAVFADIDYESYRGNATVTITCKGHLL